MIAAMREAVGPEIEVLIDATAFTTYPPRCGWRIGWRRTTSPGSRSRCRRRATTRSSRCATRVPTRICVGERLYTRFEFVPIFENRLADYVMPDVTWTGGITELKKIATMAETYYIPISPHDASGPINILAGAHVAMTVPNFYRLESRRADMGFYNAFIEEPLVVRDGALIVSDRPGLGVTMNMEYLRAHAAPGWGGERRA